MYAVHQNADKPYQDIVKFYGFKLDDKELADYIEICERATVHPQSDNNSSVENTARRTRKSDKKKKAHKTTKQDKAKHKRPRTSKKNEGDFYCAHHGPNDTYSSKDCYTLKNAKEKRSKSKNVDQKTRELNLIEAEIQIKTHRLERRLAEKIDHEQVTQQDNEKGKRRLSSKARTKTKSKILKFQLKIKQPSQTTKIDDKDSSDEIFSSSLEEGETKSDQEI